MSDRCSKRFLKKEKEESRGINSNRSRGRNELSFRAGFKAHSESQFNVST